VENLGNVSETFNVTCLYDSNLIGVMRVINLGAGNQTVISFAWDTTGIVPGTYSIGAEADSSGEIAESNEDNNNCTYPAAVRIVIHDIAVLSQTPSPVIVMQGEIVTVEVEVKNEGTELETFNVSCYYDDTFLETKTITDLAPNATIILVFYWNTTDTSPGTYYINAAAPPIVGEVDTDDNACRSVASVTIESEQHLITFNQYGVDTDFTGTVVIIDGADYTVADLSASFMWDEGSIHTFNFLSPLVVSTNSKQYVWVSTSGLSTARSDSMTVTESGNITAYYDTQYYLVISSPYAIPSGEGWYNSGSTAYASVNTAIEDHANDTRRVFASWSGDASGTNYAGSNPIEMDAPKTAEAEWKTQYYLTVETDPSGLAVIPGEGWYDRSTSAYLTAPSITSYIFLNWTVDSIPQSPGQKSVTIDMNAPHNAVAAYRPVTVGGVAVSIESSIGNAWIVLNVLVAMAALVVAIYVRRQKKK
jgi:hypothetical protein